MDFHQSKMKETGKLLNAFGDMIFYQVITYFYIFSSPWFSYKKTVSVIKTMISKNGIAARICVQHQMINSLRKWRTPTKNQNWSK